MKLSSIFLLGILLFPISYLHAQVGTPHTYRNAIVVSGSDLASAAGRDILKKGGNAFDAAVTVSFVLAVTHPAAGNIGGGGFMVARMKSGTSLALDFREKAPKKATASLYLDKNGVLNTEAALHNHLSVGVPGTVDGMIQILEKYGRLPLDMVLEPAIKLAKNGYELRYEDAFLLNKHRDAFARWPASAAIFIKPDGQPWNPGDRLVQADLARTLERIARNGRNGFYGGETADFIIQDMKKNGGVMELSDLKDYRSEWRTPLQFTFRDRSIVTMPPPSAGGVTLQQIAKMVEKAPLETMRYGSADGIHLMVEAMRRAYADRNYFLGDPAFIKNPISEMTDSIYLAQRFSTFSPEKATSSSEVSHGAISSFTEPTETTHFSIVDQEGTAVSITTTLNSSFGNKIVVPGTGMLWNNQIDDFSLKPGVPNQFGLVSSKTNALKPGKRMLSSMTPVIVLRNGKLELLLGASGGSTITTTVFQIFINTTLYGMNMQQAVAAPRFHHQWLPDKIMIDPFGLDETTRQKLVSMGHNVEFRSAYIGRAECIMIDENGLHGAADPRGQDGIAGF